MLVFVFMLQTSGALTRRRYCRWRSAAASLQEVVYTIRPIGRIKLGRGVLTFRATGRFTRKDRGSGRFYR